MHSEESRIALWPYVIAIASVGLIAAVRWIGGTYLAGNSPLLPFTIAIVLSACLGGRLPGMLATLLGGIVGEYLFLPQTRPFFLATPTDMMDLGVFLFVGTAISLLIHMVHMARFRSDAQREHALVDEEKLRLLTDSVHDYALALLDADGRFVSWNLAGLRILGYPSAEILGRHICFLYTDTACESGEPQSDLESAAALGRRERQDVRIRRDGSRLSAHTVLTAIHTEDGRLRGFAVVLREMPGQLPSRLEEALTQSREATAIASI
jgi:two-component system sensor kinase FixL